MTKKIWRDRWLGSLNELTSLELQKKSWLDLTNTNPHWSFIEFMSCYFDDLVLEDNYQHPLENGWVTKQEYEIIKDWHNALDKYTSPNNDDYYHQAILNDAKWLDIVKSGQIVKDRLKQFLTTDEIQILILEKKHYIA